MHVIHFANSNRNVTKVQTSANREPIQKTTDVIANFVKKNAMFLRSQILVENSLMLPAAQLKRTGESTLISVTLPKLFQILISQWTIRCILTNKGQRQTIGTKILISAGTPLIENSPIMNCRKLWNLTSTAVRLLLLLMPVTNMKGGRR